MCSSASPEKVELDQSRSCAGGMPLSAVTGRADVMDIARTPNPHLTFGTGTHRCIGMDLARANTELALDVARSNTDLADETLSQSRDRFSAGVTDTVEVVQSQEAVSSAHEQYISSLYSYNYAKISLVRALGIAEQGVKEFFRGK